MRSLITLLAGALLAVGLSTLSGAAGANPLFDGADPDVLVAQKQFWIYPTSDISKAKDAFYCYSSPDLKKWSEHGPILTMKDVKWIGDDGANFHELWAPGIFASGGKYYFYFAVGPQNPTPSRIGVAVADKPEGPFRDSGKPLVTSGEGWEAIDPMVYRDPDSKKVYLYCGGSAGAKLKVYELNDDLVSIKKEIPVETPKNFTEAAFIHKRGNTYYLSYSHGRWDNETYCVAYSTAPTALGPWTYKDIILKSDKQHAGPGHHCILHDPATDKWYIIYHRWNGAVANGKMPGGRSVAIEKLEYAKDGSLMPVTMTGDSQPF